MTVDAAILAETRRIPSDVPNIGIDFGESRSQKQGAIRLYKILLN